MTTLRDYIATSIMQQHDFPQNAALAIIDEVTEPISWGTDVNKLSVVDREAIRLHVNLVIDLMASTDLTEADRIRIFYGGAKLLSDKGGLSRRELIVMAWCFSEAEKYKERIFIPGYQVVIRRVRENVYRIFNRKIFTKGKP